jgi:hypothetical protein
MIGKNRIVLLLVLIGFLISSISCSSTPIINEPLQTAPTLTSEPLWTISTSTDEMSGEVSAYATSHKISPTHPMDVPYDDVEAWIGVGCSNTFEWAYIGFSTAPNLMNTDIHDGYDEISARIKWDDSIQNVRLSQTWGDRFLRFSLNSDDAIQKLQTHGTLLLELEWYGEGNIYFEFPLAGAAEGIRSMRSKCSK